MDQQKLGTGKEIIRKVLLTMGSLFLVYQSAGLIHSLANAPKDEFGWGGAVILGYLLSLFMTGVVALLTFAWPMARLLPESYYEIRHPEKLKRWYRWLGVEYFKKALLATLWRSRKQQKNYFNGTRSGLQDFIFRTKQSEFGHLVPFALILVTCIYLLFLAHYRVAGVALFFNILGNLYPVILQRNHRLRLTPMLKRK